jgi:hypothetical protein
LKTKLFGFATALMLFAASQSHATTIYVFDTPVSGAALPSGSVDLDVAGSNATFTVTLPTGFALSEFALDLTAGGTVNAGAYVVTTGSTTFGNAGKTWPKFGPFNTILTPSSGNFGNSLTFTVSNYAGIFDELVTNTTYFPALTGVPIWFVAVFTNNSGVGGVVASDAVEETPLPAALPLFAGGLGTFALLGWRRKRKAQRAA